LLIADIFTGYGDAVAQYVKAIMAKADADPALRPRLAEREKDAQTIAAAEMRPLFSHTGALLVELAAAHEWVSLRTQAERHFDSPERVLALLAKRMLALSLAHSEEIADKHAATALYQEILQDDSYELTDAGNLATLLVAAQNYDEAKTIVLNGIEKFPVKKDYFLQIGMKIVEATGDRELRDQLGIALGTRGKRD
jgi:hypothetical protein